MIEIAIGLSGLTFASVVGFGARILWRLSRLEHQHEMMWNDYKDRYNIGKRYSES